MKYIKLSIVLIVVFVFLNKISVLAADDELANSIKDDLNRVTSGNYVFFNNTTDYTYYKQVASVSIDNGCLYIDYYPDSETVYVVRCSQGSNNLNLDYVGYYYNADGDSTNQIEKHVTNIGSDNSISALSYNKRYYTPAIATNIPIFDTTDVNYNDNKNNYISNGDYSGAVNKNDLPLDVDDKIEKPCNLKITGGYNNGIAYSAYSLNKNLDFNWIQTVDTSNYTYDIDVRLTYAILSKNIGASSVTDERIDSGWIDYMESAYNGSSSVGVSINKDFFNNECFVAIAEKYKQIHGKGLALKGFEVSRIEARIRNISDGKASNFVVITIDNHSTTNNSVTVQDENGNTINDAEYDGTNNANVDFDNNTNINGDLSGLSGILNTIRNGFGLLGNNGFISFLSKYFNNIIPSSFWNLILTSVAIVIFVGIINFILKR